MSDMYVALLAASRLEDTIQDFLDARLSGQRDLVVAGKGVKLSAFRVLKGTDVNYHRGFWMAPSGKQFNWLIQESKNS